MEMLSFDCVHDALQAMTEQLAAAVRQKTGRSVPHRPLGRRDGQTAVPALGAGICTENRVVTAALLLGRRTMRPAGRPGKQFQICRRTAVSKDRHPDNHLFRIRGEEDPEQEARRYAAAVRAELPLQDGLPRFDAVVLGIGDDGHTASIFPHTPGLLTDPACYAVSRHPVTGQWRITMTGPLILNGAELLVSGHRPRKGGNPAKNRRPAGSGISRGVHPPPRRTGGGLYEL